MLTVIMEQILRRTAEEIAKNVATSAVIGGVADVALAKEDSNKVVEAGIGLTTGAAGAVASEAYRHFIKNAPGPALAAGVGASILTRYGLRAVESRFKKKEEK